jgi:hypothetical protein
LQIYALPACYAYTRSPGVPVGPAPATGVDPERDDAIDAYVLEAALVGVYYLLKEGSPDDNVPQLSQAPDESVVARLIVAAAVADWQPHGHALQRAQLDISRRDHGHGSANRLQEAAAGHDASVIHEAGRSLGVGTGALNKGYPCRHSGSSEVPTGTAERLQRLRASRGTRTRVRQLTDDSTWLAACAAACLCWNAAAQHSRSLAN